MICDQDFEKFRDYYYRKTGTFFADSKRYFVDKRLQDQINSHGYSDFKSYFSYLRFDARSQGAFQDLVNSMTVNETYFMRESYQFDCLVNEILPEITSRPRRSDQPIRILSLPCSTGEEPYSIAMTLLERWPQLNEYDVSLVATDIDSNVLEKAKAGIYSRRSIGRLPSDWLRRYFEPDNEFYESWEISDDLKQVVSFHKVNIVNERVLHSLGKFDVIFCRNLLIYFDLPSRKLAAQNLYQLLNPGGYLLLGHSESMSRISSLFKSVRFPESTVYQK